jgi:hypothetical protein
MNREGFFCAYCVSAEDWATRVSWTPFDIVLVLNVFHHMLLKNKDLAWKTLKIMLNRSEMLFLMTRRFGSAYTDFDNDIPKALKTMTGVKPELLTKVGERELYMLT